MFPFKGLHGASSGGNGRAYHVYSIGEDRSYSFELWRGVLADSPIAESTVGAFLLHGLANVEQLAASELHL